MKDNNYGIPESVLNARIEQIKAESRKEKQDDVNDVFLIISFILFWPIALIGFFLSGRK
jgi:hypothetical protein